MAPTIPIQVDRSSSRPLYGQIEEQLRAAILDGRLPPGSLVPGIRSLAGTLGVARNTVATAYDILVAEGCLEGRVGSGTRVAPDPPPGGHSAAPISGPGWRPAPRPTRGGSIDLRPSAGQLGGFPFGTWERMLRLAVRELSLAPARAPDPGGDPVLREQLALRLAAARGVVVDPGRIFVTTGDWASLSTIADLWPDQHGAAFVEDPGESYVRRLLGGRGRQIVPVPVDRAGMRTASLPAAGAGDAPRLVHVSPAWQPVLGGTLTGERRSALVTWATSEPIGSWIVEDDRDGELRLRGAPPPAIAAADRSGRLFHVRGLERDLWPGLRAGYLVAPADLAPRITALLELQARGPGAIEQRALARFLAEGHFDRHLRRSRRWLLEREALLLEAIATAGSGLLAASEVVAGRHLVVEVADPRVSAAEVAVRAGQAGVSVETVASRRLGVGSDRELLVGFAVDDVARLREGAMRIVEAARPRGLAGAGSPGAGRAAHREP